MVDIKDYKHVLLYPDVKKELDIYRVNNDLKSSSEAIKKLLEGSK